MQRFKHQQKIFDRTKDLPGYALLWEMRVGKTLPMIDTANHLCARGVIDAVLVIAPNGVHLNWSRIAIPPHMTPGVSIVEWSSAKSGNKGYQDLLSDSVDSDKFLWFCVNVEAMISPRCATFLEYFLKHRKVLLIVDESHKIKNHNAQCTKAVTRIAKKCAYRRILTGTPVTQGPFDLWSQFNVIDPTIFHEVDPLGNKVPMKFTTFKHKYGVFKKQRYGNGPVFDELIEYKDLDKLYETIQPFSSRLTQKEVYEDLPPLIHEKRLFEISPLQRKYYNELRDDLITTLESGVEITAQQAMVNLLRLQQISRGFVGDTQTVHDLGTPRPSIEALKDILEQVEGKVIIWCKFQADVKLILAMLNPTIGPTEGERKLYYSAYDGTTSTDQRQLALHNLLSDPFCRGVVGTPAAGGIGVDMSAADTMIFYSHGFNLGERLQAIARMQGPNQKSRSLLLIDMVAVGTIDERCLSVLNSKQDLASMLTGDKLRGILQ